MGTNLRLDTTAVNAGAPAKVSKAQAEAKEMLCKGDTSRDWKLDLQLDGLFLNQPNISHSDLKKITASMLIMVGDRDIIRNEHAVEMFNEIPKVQLLLGLGFDM